MCACDGRFKILVIDKLGEGFMGLWRRNFQALRISHLRSPMFFHPDASDFDALIAFANQHGRAGEGTPDQVIDQIESGLASGNAIAVPRGRGCRRRTKGKRSPSPVEAVREQSTSKSGPSNSRLPDLIEILGVVGKEKSKHKRKQQLKELHTNTIDSTSAKVHVNERDRRDYFTPSSSLFDDFTRQLEQKYRVQSCGDCDTCTWPSVSQAFDGDGGKVSSQDLLDSQGAGGDDGPVTPVKGVVKDLAWFDGSERTIQDDFGNHSPGFLLELADSATNSTSIAISAKAVVSAVGFGGVPSVPSHLAPPSQSSSPACGPGWMHSSCLASQPFPHPPPLPSSSPARERTMVVVGGGLTSAQIVIRALEEGYHKVILLTRGHLKSKPFDVDLGWVGRYSNYLKMQFWQNEDVQERLNMLRAARNGGSVTPTYAKVLARLQALGKVEVRTHTTIAKAEYEGRWSLETRKSADGGRVDEVQADYLIVATGAKVNFGGLPFLKHLQKSHPIPLVGGLPVLTADLEYRRDVPLFVTGAYAGLQIGPAAGNLGGMRDSADRIANRLLELLSLPEGGPPQKVQPEATPAETRQERQKEHEASSFTHFNFDLLSIEA